MRFVLTGDSDCPIARLALSRGESVKIENGSMVYSRGVEISGGLNSKKKGLGGVLGAIGRSITSGESMFITTATERSPSPHPSPARSSACRLAGSSSTA